MKKLMFIFAVLLFAGFANAANLASSGMYLLLTNSSGQDALVLSNLTSSQLSMEIVDLVSGTVSGGSATHLSQSDKMNSEYQVCKYSVDGSEGLQQNQSVYMGSAVYISVSNDGKKAVVSANGQGNVVYSVKEITETEYNVYRSMTVPACM
jgi:hypothetical protein